MEKVTIRDMSDHDLDGVYLLEAGCDPVPWSVSALKYELENKESILKVALLDDTVIGYTCIRTLLDVTHVMKISVNPEYRRNGVGRLLLTESIKLLRTLKPGVKYVTLEVRESNYAAITLYDNSGFKRTGKRINYYRNPVEDGLIMQLDLSIVSG